MGIDAETIAEIVRRVLSVAQPERIILFGSAATGKMTRDSDIDLLILERNPENARAESQRIREALWGIGRPCDVFIMATVRFEESKDVIGGLAFPANKYGTIIYSAA
jgi:predicted nucleotidyltransferase